MTLFFIPEACHSKSSIPRPKSLLSHYLTALVYAVASKHSGSKTVLEYSMVSRTGMKANEQRSSNMTRSCIATSLVFFFLDFLFSFSVPSSCQILFLVFCFCFCLFCFPRLFCSPGFVVLFSAPSQFGSIAVLSMFLLFSCLPLFVFLIVYASTFPPLVSKVDEA